MKKTIWQPLVLGTVLGLLVGIATVTGLSFLIPGTDTEIAIGFFITFFLLAAALGGPLAGAIAPAIWVTISAWYGPPELKAISSIPAVFWSNLIVSGALMALVGFTYRMIFERVKMPLRLLFWAGIVIAFYLIISPITITSQYLLLGEIDVLPAILFSYQTYIPQVIFDIFFTCLVFIALPARYSRPVWYEPKQTPELNSEIQGA
jgi:MFS family permease